MRKCFTIMTIQDEPQLDEIAIPARHLERITAQTLVRPTQQCDQCERGHSCVVPAVGDSSRSVPSHDECPASKARFTSAVTRR
jgi:hypothetical protein